MRWDRWIVVSLGVVILAVGVMLVPQRTSAAADAVTDAKRKAAIQLLKEGKPADALSLMAEVTKADDTQFSDHLILAHIQEKLGLNQEAMRQYRRVMELVPASSSKADEKAAHAEADRKLKMMDPMAAKTDVVIEDFVRKLDALEKDAIASRNIVALARVFRLRGMTWQADGVTDRGYLEVKANAGWQPVSMDIKPGQRYRIRAAGTWRVHAKAGSSTMIDCTAAGVSGTSEEPSGNWGSLFGNMPGKGFFIVGENNLVTLVPGAQFNVRDDGTAADRSGSVQVVITPE